MLTHTFGEKTILCSNNIRQRKECVRTFQAGLESGGTKWRWVMI